MLDKNKIWVILSFEFKMGHKALETTHNINNAFGPGTANECTMQWWFKEFCKKDKDLEDEFSAWPSEGDNDPMRALSKLILLQVCQKLPKTSTILWWFSIWSKLERWKSSIIGASWVDWKKKNHHFEVSSSLTLYKNSEPFRYWTVMYDEKGVL